MPYSPLLAPLVTLVLWTFVMCGWLYATWIPATNRNNVIYGPVRPANEFHAQLPPSVRWKPDNYNNLREQPTLFYAVALALALFGAGSGLNLMLVWLYPGLRVLHSLIQAIVNKTALRYPLFLISKLVLLAITIRVALLDV